MGRARRQVKLAAAIAGGAAVVAIGAMNVATTAESGHADAVKSTTMTIGATSTEATPPKAPAVEEAVPAIKGPAPLPSEEEAAK
ncbi:hypothetical protein FZ046_25425 [Mycolicibacterium grossiae]|nr:hypothetical protein FZ046_25425 [Mycolicibacterium grossiae]